MEPVNKLINMRRILASCFVVSVIALTAALCCVSAFAADELPPDIVLTEDTTIVNLSGGYNGIERQTIDTNGYTLTLLNTEDTEFVGTIIGSGDVIKTGSGSLKLSHLFKGVTTVFAEFQYTGKTYIQEGTLDLTVGQVLLSNTSQVINNSVIVTDKNQYFKNLSGTGTINASSGAMITLVNSGDSVFSGVINGEGTPVRVGGDGELTLSGANTYTGGTTVINYQTSSSTATNGHLKLTGSALNYIGVMSVNGGKSVEFDVSGVKSYTITAANKIEVKYGGEMIKSGDGTMQICCESAGLVSVDSMFISSGRIDYEGYFESTIGPGSSKTPTDCFVVEAGATYSPGIGIGNTTFNNSNLTIRDNGIALFEFGAYNENPSQQNYDTVTINNGPYRFVTSTNSIIELEFTNNDAWKWAKEGAEYRIISAENGTFKSIAGDYSYLLGDYSEYFKLVGRDYDGYYLIGLGAPEPEPETAVSEPSTWALMALGVVVLFLRKRVRN